MNTSTATITEDEHFAIFFLSHVDTIGCETIKRIDSRLDHIVDIFNMQDKDLKPVLSMSEAQIYEFINVKKQLPSIIREYELLLRSDIRFCTFKDNTYPCRLKKIRHNPAVLYSYGSLPSDNVPSVGIVGSRACTAYGASVAEHLAEVLADNGVNIISGMAVGIDTAAHKGSLRSAHNHTDQIDNGTYQGSSFSHKCYTNGKSYAVLAGGVNVIYPRENKYIYEDIVYGHNGAVISEIIPGKAAISRNFPMRNRIISGLSDIIIVVEAREKSGSLITADYARVQNVPVMAVPGRITDPMSMGTNKLLSDGFDIVTSPLDILKRLKIDKLTSSVKNKEKVKLLDNAEKIVYSTVVSDPKHIEIIFQETALPSDKVMEALISLELQGLISQVSSNYYIRN